MIKNTVTILREARALIIHPASWTKRANARDILGRQVQPDSRRAVSWCSIGALLHVGGGSTNTLEAAKLLGDAARVMWYYGSVNLNDAGDQSLVLMMFDKAIEMAEKTS